MTNKVKPFYIKITDDMTPQIVQDAFDKCVDAGVEVVGNIHDWNYVGVRENGIVHFSMFEACFHGIKEITLGQLDEWLGLEVEQEWKSGDECEHGHHDYSGANKMTYIGAHPFVGGKHVCLSELKGIVIVDSVWLRKPETPEQKAERERQYAVYDMCSDLDNHTDDARFWCEKLYDAGYRKQ